MISYVSPIAKLLIGASVGDEIALPDGTAEITAIH
jgi:transcription elongation GreA/GreB family factor